MIRRSRFARHSRWKSYFQSDRSSRQAALTPLIRPGRIWPVLAAYIYGCVHVGNALGHITISVTSRWLMPGVISSPPLLPRAPQQLAGAGHVGCCKCLHTRGETEYLANTAALIGHNHQLVDGQQLTYRIVLAFESLDRGSHQLGGVTDQGDGREGLMEFNWFAQDSRHELIAALAERDERLKGPPARLGGSGEHLLPDELDSPPSALDRQFSQRRPDAVGARDGLAAQCRAVRRIPTTPDR